MSYRVKLSPSAQRQIDRLHGDTYMRVKSTIDKLTQNPRPSGCRKLASGVNEWRIRVGTYRIIYTIDDSAREILIHRVGHRRDVYEA